MLLRSYTGLHLGVADAIVAYRFDASGCLGQVNLLVVAFVAYGVVQEASVQGVLQKHCNPELEVQVGNLEELGRFRGDQSNRSFRVLCRP